MDQTSNSQSVDDGLRQRQVEPTSIERNNEQLVASVTSHDDVWITKLIWFIVGTIVYLVLRRLLFL